MSDSPDSTSCVVGGCGQPRSGGVFCDLHQAAVRRRPATTITGGQKLALHSSFLLQHTSRSTELFDAQLNLLQSNSDVEAMVAPTRAMAEPQRHHKSAFSRSKSMGSTSRSKSMVSFASAPISPPCDEPYQPLQSSAPASDTLAPVVAPTAVTCVVNTCGDKTVLFGYCVLHLQQYTGHSAAQLGGLLQLATTSDNTVRVIPEQMTVLKDESMSATAEPSIFYPDTTSPRLISMYVHFYFIYDLFLLCFDISLSIHQLIGLVSHYLRNPMNASRVQRLWTHYRSSPITCTTNSPPCSSHNLQFQLGTLSLHPQRMILLRHLQT
jgi:hypothetical protein